MPTRGYEEVFVLEVPTRGYEDVIIEFFAFVNDDR